MKGFRARTYDAIPYHSLEPPAPTCERLPMKSLGEFDYVIVGAGSAGCVLVARLSESGKPRVALIEAGGENDAF